MARRDDAQENGFVLDTTLFLDAWGRGYRQEEQQALSFMKGSMFTSEFIERELRRRRNWKHKFGVLGLLRHLVRVLRPDVMLLNRLAHGQKTRMADWSLLAVAEQLDERRDMYVVSNDTTIAADITRSAVGCCFLDDESFLRLLISLATFYPSARAGHLVTIYSRVRDSIVNRASRDQE